MGSIKHDFNKGVVDKFHNEYIRTYARDNLKIKQALSYTGNRPSWYITKRLISEEMKRLRELPMVPVYEYI